MDLYSRQFSTNGTSKGLNADEAAANIKRIMTHGKTQAEVARMIGKSAQYVSQMLGFQEAPEEVREMVAKGEVSTSAAMATLRKEGPAKGAATLKAGVSKAKASGRKRATKRDMPSNVTPHSDTAVIVDRRLMARIIRALRQHEENDLLEDCVKIVGGE
jgi:ParB-like chromosome segregation protein Spo0J